MTREMGKADRMIELPQEFFDDPYPVYARLRAQGPVHEVRFPDGMRGWIVVDYEAVREVLRNPTVHKELNPALEVFKRAFLPQDRPKRTFTRVASHMLNTDPPNHTRLRKLVAPAFVPRRIEALEPRILAIAGELLDRIAEATGPVDLLTEYAFPLPITVICELVGMPVEDREQFREWSNLAIDNANSSKDEVQRAITGLEDYFDQLIERRRGEEPGEDLISALLAATEDGDRLSHDEMVSMLFLLLIAGHETTVNLIGNTVLALLTEPEKYRALHGNPDAVPGLLEETLRYDSPVNLATFRYTTEPITVAGTTIPADQLVFCALGSANRDERRFPGSEIFDPDRPQPNHVAFGYGIHFCLGAHLARLEGRIALTELVRRYPDLRLVEGAQLRWRESTIIRGLRELPVEFASAPALR
ncbi:cytochrome P450 [Nocardia panacis]|uniref:Cytochrome P450 n=1 Tax=Nocardia panacis TaxID=2340916 RepID=A0A3A4KFQ2_9NOCA|nr:cytochrome P450 [Nocardia panacis]RJO72947.1 cytochrome P450 [Nocardia panacis]